MEDATQPAPTDLIGVTITIAGIAVALAALTLDRGPEIGNVRVLPTVLLFAGLPSVIASLYSMAELMWEAGLTRSDIFFSSPAIGPSTSETPYTREAILFTAWSLYLLLAAYAVLLLAAGGL